MSSGTQIEIIFTEPEEQKARDPLGFSSLVERKREGILPGIVSTTSKAWYYLICSIYEHPQTKIKERQLAKVLDIFFLKSNCHSNKYDVLRGILGKSRIEKIKNEKKLSKMRTNWINLTSYHYYGASYRKLFKKNTRCPLSKNQLKKIKDAIFRNELKPIPCLNLSRNNNEIKKWLRTYIIGDNKLNEFYQFIKRHNNSKDKERIVRRIFIDVIDDRKYKELNDIPVIEAFLWAYEAIFKIKLNLLNNGERDNNKVPLVNPVKDPRGFLNGWNEYLERLEQNINQGEDESEESGKDESKDVRASWEEAREEKLKKLSEVMGFLELLKNKYNDQYRELKKELGCWINSPRDELLEKILQHHYDLKGVSAFITRKNGAWRLNSIGEKHCDLPYFPKHYYGICNFMHIIDDIDK